MRVTRKYNVKELRKQFFPKLGTYDNTWGLTVEGMVIASFIVERYNTITYVDSDGKHTHKFQDICYIDD